MSSGVRKNQKAGFTLVEIMIVVVIIGLLAAFAIPAFSKSRQSASASRIANDMKKVGASFYVIIMKDDTIPVGIYNQGFGGGAPDGFDADRVPELYRSKPLGIDSGLTYEFGAGLAAANEGVVVLSKADGISDDIMAAVDKILDDGNISTGRILKQSDTQLIYKSYIP